MIRKIGGNVKKRNSPATEAVELIMVLGPMGVTMRCTRGVFEPEDFSADLCELLEEFFGGLTEFVPID